jgi:CRISPR/Cas system-associated exonuclease Cas4 (RecB family)
MRKVQAKRLARQISGEVTGPTGFPHISEHPAEAFGGRLRGRADVVIRGPHHEIRDYKTGAITEPGSNELKAEYRTQMLLYAALEHEETGEWPSTATIIPLEGERFEIAVDPGEAQACAEHALEALEAYNAAIETEATWTALARPAPHTCRFCPYASRCPAFWQAATPEWEGEGVRAVAGPVLSVENAQQGLVALEIAVGAGTIPAESTWIYAVDPSAFPVVAEISRETFIAATALLASGPSMRPSERTLLVAATAESKS